MQTPTAPAVFRQPSAFIPLLMSLAACLVLANHLLIFGTAREVDEGPSAHLFQLLMLGQVPVIAYFAIKWLRLAPERALLVLGAQLLSAAVALAPVALLGL
jgi:hypothetical protein